MCELNCARLVILIPHMIAEGFCKARDVFLECFAFCLVSLLPCALPCSPAAQRVPRAVFLSAQGLLQQMCLDDRVWERRPSSAARCLAPF